MYEFKLLLKMMYEKEADRISGQISLLATTSLRTPKLQTTVTTQQGGSYRGENIQITTYDEDPVKTMSRKWYTLWTKGERDWAIMSFRLAHGNPPVGELAGKVFYFKDKPSGFIGIPAWVEQFVWYIQTKPEFPFEILYNIFSTGNVILTPPKSAMDVTYNIDIPLMGYIVQFWWPSVNKSQFTAQQIKDFEYLMTNKNSIPLSTRILGPSVGEGINYFVPKELNPNISPDTITYIEYGLIGVGALILVGATGYAANEIKNVIK